MIQRLKPNLASLRSIICLLDVSSDEKTKAPTIILEDPDGINKLSGISSKKKNTLPSEVRELISDKRWSSKLPSTLLMWVTAQVRPFTMSSAQNYGSLQDEAKRVAINKLQKKGKRKRREMSCQRWRELL